MNVHDDGYCEDYACGDSEVSFNAPIIQVIGDGRTCRPDYYGTLEWVEHCRVGLVPYYLTCHCKLAATDSSTLVEELRINFGVAPICIHYFHTIVVMTNVYINPSERISNAFHVVVIEHSNSECYK